MKKLSSAILLGAACVITYGVTRFIVNGQIIDRMRSVAMHYDEMARNRDGDPVAPTDRGCYERDIEKIITVSGDNHDSRDTLVTSLATGMILTAIYAYREQKRIVRPSTQ